MANTFKFGNGNWATKEDSVLAYNDENNNFKPLPFDFTRASTATYVDSDGLIKTAGNGEARIDYTDSTDGALLLEPSRSNLVLTSASGTYGNSPASETNTISPDGTNNAVIPTPDSVSDRYDYSVSSGAYATDTKLSYSWYRKRISTPIIPSHIGDLKIQILVNVTQVGSTTQIESDVNGFDRFQAIFNITDGSASSIIRAYFGGAIGVGNSSVAYFGHQLEQGSYATSYIPTSGSAVTRVADVCEGAGNSEVFNDSEGVLYAEISALANDLTNRTIGVLGDSNNFIELAYRNSSNQVRCLIKSNGVVEVNIQHTLSDITLNNKLAIKYKLNNVSLYVNGIEVGTDLSANMPSGLNELNFNRFDGGENYYGKVKEVRVYNTALTDAELATLTT